MKTSWNDMQSIEHYIHETGDGGDRTLFSARLLVDPQLKDNLRWQQATYAMVREYGRQKLREEITQVAQQLFTARQHEPFRQKILRIFK